MSHGRLGKQGQISGRLSPGWAEVGREGGPEEEWFCIVGVSVSTWHSFEAVIEKLGL